MVANRPPSPSTRRGYLTAEEVLALPRPLVDLVTAGRAARMSRETAYRRAKTGDFPVPVLRVGRALMVRTRDLHGFLGLSESRPALDRRLDAWVQRQLENAAPLSSETRELLRRLLKAPTEKSEPEAA